MPSKTSPSLLAEDIYLRAAALGRTAAGVSGPNPPVGCVVVKDGAIVGEGATGAVGGPHAEVVALEAAGPSARDAVAVVTLEPCSHQGRTGPCTEALLAAGIREVHVVSHDPDPRAAGGTARLRDAGVVVVEVAAHLPAVADVVAHDLRGFFTRVRAHRPHVTLKLAQSIDGHTTPGPSGYLTGIAARTRVHELRADVDAVLVGSTTVRVDDPRLDVRHIVAARSPRPVVIATRADIDPAARIVSRAAIVLVGPEAPAPACDALTAAGASIVRVARAADGSEGIDLQAALAALLEQRILTVLAEPGPRLAEALLAADLIDEVELHIAGASTSGATVEPGTVVAAIGSLVPLVEAWRSGSDAIIVEELDGDVVLRAAWGAWRSGAGSSSDRASETPGPRAGEPSTVEAA